MTMFKVYEKGTFYRENTEEEFDEEEFIDGECSWASMVRDGSIVITSVGAYGVCDLHWIENDNDESYRVERGEQ